jgi:hypothetical protein
MKQIPPEVKLAIGRLLRMMRGDLPFNMEAYHACRSIVLNAVLDASPEPIADYAPNWAKQRLNGAQGD